MAHSWAHPQCTVASRSAPTLWQLLSQKISGADIEATVWFHDSLWCFATMLGRTRLPARCERSGEVIAGCTVLPSGDTVISGATEEHVQVLLLL